MYCYSMTYSWGTYIEPNVTINDEDYDCKVIVTNNNSNNDNSIQSISLDILTGDIFIDGKKDEYEVKKLYRELYDTTIINGDNHMNDAIAAMVESMIYVASSYNDPSSLARVNSTHPNDVLTMNRNFMSLEENLESAKFIERCYDCEDEYKDFHLLN